MAASSGCCSDRSVSTSSPTRSAPSSSCGDRAPRWPGLTARSGMTDVVPVEALRRSAVSSLFQGADHGGVAISVFVTTWPAGRGPVLHEHPYPEVFLVEAGEVMFKIGRASCRERV